MMASSPLTGVQACIMHVLSEIGKQKLIQITSAQSESPIAQVPVPAQKNLSKSISRNSIRTDKRPEGSLGRQIPKTFFKLINSATTIQYFLLTGIERMAI